MEIRESVFVFAPLLQKDIKVFFLGVFFGFFLGGGISYVIYLLELGSNTLHLIHMCLTLR